MPSSHLPPITVVTPFKEDSTHSKSSSYSPHSHSPEYSANPALNTPASRVNAPILSPPITNSAGTPVNSAINAPGELWSVARLTALERDVVAAANAETNIHQHHHQQHHSSSSLNGYYNGENLIVNGKVSAASSASPSSISPTIYGHHSSASASIQKPIATFYRHELAKQFHLYRSHHSVVEPPTTSGTPNPNGVV